MTNIQMPMGPNGNELIDPPEPEPKFIEKFHGVAIEFYEGEGYTAGGNGYYDTVEEACEAIEDWEYEDRAHDPEYDGIDFADPGGRSALRAATKDNPRIYPCPTCNAPNRLTPADVALCYCCDACADRAERGGY